MFLPGHVCQALYRVNPMARYAWAGRPAKEGELDAGNYALVQLYPSKLVGSLDEPNILEDLWYVTDGFDVNGHVQRMKIDRGPIFNRCGGTTPDWDELEYIPVFKAKFVDYRISDEVVYSGGAGPVIRRWMEPNSRFQKEREQRGRDLKQRVREIGEEGGKRLWHEAKKHTSSGAIIPYSSEVRKEMDEFHASNSGLEDYYNPNRVMKGVGNII